MRPARGPGRAAGFTLIEIAVVIVVLAFILAMIAGIATAMVGQQRREATRQRLAGVDTALALFVSQNKRLPCPADGQVVGTAAGAGAEARNAANGSCNIDGVDNRQTRGVVPWQSLGLSEPDITDGWGNRLTYRVAPELAKYPNNAIAAFGAMDFTYCDPGGVPYTNPPTNTIPNLETTYNLFCRTDCSSSTFPNACTPPSIYTFNKGLSIRNLAGTTIMNPAATPSTGAAYVVVSHGENGKGAYNNQGVLQEASSTDSGTEEAKNAANLALAAYYVDDFPSYPAGTGHFDDFLLRPSILTVATKAQLGPRAH